MGKMKKGDLVRLSSNCFTTANGGSRKYPSGTHGDDDLQIFRARRPITESETRGWYNSDASKGMNDAGESKLPPQSVSVTLKKNGVYPVLRARCRIRLGYGNPTPGMAKILCTDTGEIAYVKRDFLEVVT